ncbi:MAG: hypothetical protein KDH09_02495 [Chrysiogenetes bacterium]|nr:hypothetical protein [Chrysiogenetes bacterium]
MADKKKEHKPLQVPMREGDNTDAVMAGLVISPELSAGMVAHAFTGNTLGDDVAGITELTAALKDTTKRVNDGDLSTLEAMLVAQATALQGIFTSYAKRAQIQQYQKNLESFMGMALRAQAQSRATIQALVDLKFPRQATFVKQANIAHGPQQVNNGVLSPPKEPVTQPAHAHENNRTEQTKLLEDTRSGSTYLDIGTTPAAARGHRAVEAVGAVHRPKKPRGKGKG